MSTQTRPVTFVAKLLLLTPRHVQRLANDGVIPKDKRGQYELVPAIQGYIRYLRNLASDGGGSPEEGHLAGRARLITAKAKLTEIELAVKEGTLLPADEVESAWSRLVADCRAKLLGLPTRIAPVVVGCNSIAEVKEILESAITAILTDLAAGRTDEQGEEGLPTTAEVDDLRVGGSVSSPIA